MDLKGIIDKIIKQLKSNRYKKEICSNLFPNKDARELEKIAARAIADVISVNGTVDLIGGSHFPDIRFEYQNKLYGIEVKRILNSKSEKTLGNSVNNESSNDIPAERTFALLFKALGDGNYIVEIKPYYNCITGIVVSHYPRFSLSFNNDGNNSFEENIGCSVKDFRKNPIKRTIKYFEDQKIPIWGVSPEEKKIFEKSIKFYRSLDRDIKNELNASMLLKFPYLFTSKKSNNYDDAIKWLVSNGIVHTSLRDNFSAGGKNKRIKSYTTNEMKETVKKVINHIDTEGSFLGIKKDDIILDVHRYLSNNEIVEKDE